MCNIKILFSNQWNPPQSILDEEFYYDLCADAILHEVWFKDGHFQISREEQKLSKTLKI